MRSSASFSAVVNWKWPEYQKCNCNQTEQSLEQGKKAAPGVLHSGAQELLSAQVGTKISHFSLLAVKNNDLLILVCHSNCVTHQGSSWLFPGASSVVFAHCQN